MPRNSNGDYTLPAGNPVVTGTTISSTWANTTLADIGNALTDSLSRSGDGSMTAPLLLDDGAIGAPALSWGNETTSGLYRAGAGDFRWAIGGADKIQITTNGLGVADGAVGTPSLFFVSDPDTGIYRFGTNSISLALGGLEYWRFVNTPNGQLLGGNGTVALPLYSFLNDPDTGMYRFSADNLAFTVGGTLTFNTSIANTNVNVGVFRVQDGTASDPSLTFVNDPDTGFYRVSSNVFRVTAGTSPVLEFDGNTSVAVKTLTLMAIQDGTAGIPGISFVNDLNTGMYRVGADQLGFSAGGVVNAVIRANSVDFYTAGAGGGTLAAQVQAVQSFWQDGSVSQPGISFLNDPDTGFYRVGTNDIALTVGGVAAFEAFNGAGVTQVGFGNGSVSQPSISFFNDFNSGLFRFGADDIGISVGGTTAYRAALGSNFVSVGINSATELQFLAPSTATASAGGGAATPATVATFMTINHNGSIRKIALYNS
jgi:hypothetical protein